MGLTQEGLHGAGPLQSAFKILTLATQPSLGPTPREIWRTAGGDGGVLCQQQQGGEPPPRKGAVLVTVWGLSASEDGGMRAMSTPESPESL